VKIYYAGGEGLPRSRQKQMFTDGVRHRLVSFFTGKGPTNKVVNCALEWEKEQEEKEKDYAFSGLEDSSKS
jgi:hypothetical protein